MSLIFFSFYSAWILKISKCFITLKVIFIPVPESNLCCGHQLRFIYIFWYFMIILLFQNSIIKQYVLFSPHYFLLYFMNTKLFFFPSWFFWVDIFFLVYSVAISTVSVYGLHHLPLHSVKPGNELPNLFFSPNNVE